MDACLRSLSWQRKWWFRRCNVYPTISWEARGRELGMVKDWKGHQEKHWFDGKAEFWFTFVPSKNMWRKIAQKKSSPNIPPKCQGKKPTRACWSSWNGADWAKKKRALRRCDGTAASGELDESHEPPRPGIVHEESLAESRASATNAGVTRSSEWWEGIRDSVMVFLFESGPNSFFLFVWPRRFITSRRAVPFVTKIVGEDR